MQLPEVDADEVAQRLAEAVRHRTISHQAGTAEAKIKESEQALLDFRDWLAKTYPSFSAVARREVVGDYSLLFTWQGTDASLDPMLLMSHMDVVPVDSRTEPDWVHSPFSGALADGYVWGRGTLDTKGSLVAMLEAAERLIREGHQPKRTILFAFGHDEENGGLQGNKKIAELLASRAVRLFFSSDEGGGLAGHVFPGVDKDIALIGVAEKGLLAIELIARAGEGHASSPLSFDQLAIGKLASVLKRVGELRFRNAMAAPTQRMFEALAPETDVLQRFLYNQLWLSKPLLERLLGYLPASSAWFHTTMAPTIVSGGVKDNVLPSEARAVVNLRLHFVDTVSGVLERIRQAAGADAEVKVLGPTREASPVSNMEGQAFKLLKAIIQETYPGMLVAPYLVAACTDSVYYQPLTDSVFRFVPLPIGSDDLPRIHGINERVAIEKLGRAVSFYLRLMLSAGDAPSTAANLLGD